MPSTLALGRNRAGGPLREIGPPLGPGCVHVHVHCCELCQGCMPEAGGGRTRSATWDDDRSNRPCGKFFESGDCGSDTPRRADAYQRLDSFAGRAPTRLPSVSVCVTSIGVLARDLPRCSIAGPGQRWALKTCSSPVVAPERFDGAGRGVPLLPLLANCTSEAFGCAASPSTGA